MATQRKSDERIKAETVGYTYDSLAPWAHTEQLRKDLTGTALKLTTGESVVTEKWSVIRNTIDHREHTPESYVEYLRSLDPEQRKDIVFAANIMQAYEPLRHDAEETLLHNEGSANYLGSGSNGSVYKMSHGGVEYAVKHGGVGHHEMRAARFGQNIDGISHIVAMDIDNRIGVMNYVPGRVPEKMSKEEMALIPDEHIRAAIDKSIEMYEAGLAVDPKQSNFLYDAKNGFGIIDYSAFSKKHEMSKSDQVFFLASVLREHSGHERVSDHSIVMVNRFLDMIEQEYPDILKEAVAENKKEKEDPRIGYTLGPTGIDIYNLPSGEIFEAFKARVIKLALDGKPYKKN